MSARVPPGYDLGPPLSVLARRRWLSYLARYRLQRPCAADGDE